MSVSVGWKLALYSGLLLCAILIPMYGHNYKNYSRRESIQLICTLTATGAFCCWLFWACVLIAQANPMIDPVRAEL